MLNSTTKPMTYGRLNQTLRDLGFTTRRTTRVCFDVFQKEDQEARILLPLTSPDDRISTWHLLSVQKAVTERKIATVGTLERMLTRRARSNGNGLATVVDKVTAQAR